MKPDQPSSRKPFDGLLDPLPVPDVTESDTDTAWGLWEASVDGLVEGYEPTLPAGLDGEPLPDKR